jgi:glc operon protein GlcG
MGLSLVDANRVIEGALAKARELGVKVSVAICDTGGRANVVAAAGGILIAGKGGVPLVRDGTVVGACGVAGATWDQDETCARSGVECL